MSTQPMYGGPVRRVARKVRLFLLALLLSGILGALGLGFAGYHAYQVGAAVSEYATAGSLYRAETAAIHQLSDMEKAFYRFLLDGNSSNLTLMERDKESVEQLAQQDAGLRADKLLQEMVAKAQGWYSQVQPLVEQRKNLPAGQGLSEEFLTEFRRASPDLNLISYEMKTESAYRQALEGVELEKQRRLGVLLTSLTAAILLIILAFASASAALRHVGGL